MCLYVSLNVTNFEFMAIVLRTSGSFVLPTNKCTKLLLLHKLRSSIRVDFQP